MGLEVFFRDGALADRRIRLSVCGIRGLRQADLPASDAETGQRLCL